MRTFQDMSERKSDGDDSDSDSSSDFCYEKDNEGEYGFGCYTKDDKVDAHDEDDGGDGCDDGDGGVDVTAMLNLCLIDG